MFCIIVFLVIFIVITFCYFVYLGGHCSLLNPPLQLDPTIILGNICNATREPPTIEPLAPPRASVRYLANRGTRRFKNGSRAWVVELRGFGTGNGYPVVWKKKCSGFVPVCERVLVCMYFRNGRSLPLVKCLYTEFKSVVLLFHVERHAMSWDLRSHQAAVGGASESTGAIR
jgi:hypothetical protein